MPAINIRAQTPPDIDAMSAEELDAEINKLLLLQQKLSPVRVDEQPSGFGFSLGGGWDDVPDYSPLRDGWREDADNLRGDMERVGLDMWIGLLRTARANKHA